MTIMLVTGGIFLWGVAVGSFLNAVIIRVHERRSFVFGRSACPHCHRPLRWFELLPVISYLIQRGRCRRCSQRLSAYYLGVEVLTGLFFVFVWLAFGWSWSTVAGWLTASGMILVAVYDGRWGLIPDSFTLVLALGAVASALLAHLSWINMVLGAVGGALFFLIQYWVSQRRWVGSGDVGIGICLGLLLGWRFLGLSLLVTYLVGGVAVAILLITRIKTVRDQIAFGPLLMLGGLVAWLYGEQIVQWYFQHALFQ